MNGTELAKPINTDAFPTGCASGRRRLSAAFDGNEGNGTP